MSRVQTRLRVVAVIALVLVLAGASSAAAGPLTKGGSTPTIGTASHWLDAVSAWIGGLFDFSGGKEVRKTTGKTPQGPSHVTAPAQGDNAHLNNGSCIDPMGGPRCAV